MKRILFWDYARAIALFLVVFAHLYTVDSDVRLYIYAFHMPFFFIASGYLHRDSNIRLLINKLFQRLIIPFMAFLAMGYAFHVVGNQSLSLNVAYASIKGIVLGRHIAANSILWFLLALFWVRIMGALFIRMPSHSVWIYLCIFALVNYSHLNILYIGSSLMALPFYLWGYYGKGFTDKLVQCKYNLFYAVLFLCMTVLISLYNGKVSMMGMSFGMSSYLPLRILLFYVNGIIGSYLLVCLVGGVKLKMGWLLYPSHCALSIVGLQVIPMKLWSRIVGFNQNLFYSFMYSLLIILCCILFHLYVEKHAKWIVGGK